jgi:hypothetical protein
VKDLNRRHRALLKTQARFGRKPAKLGSEDCVQLTRFHLKAMGHKNLPSTGRYQTGAGAVRALRNAGFKTLGEMMDSLLPRIPPAMMLPGDVGLVAADPEDPTAMLGGGLVICLGTKFWAWMPDRPQELSAVEPFAQPYIAAWRA